MSLQRSQVPPPCSRARFSGKVAGPIRVQQTVFWHSVGVFNVSICVTLPTMSH